MGLLDFLFGNKAPPAAPTKPAPTGGLLGAAAQAGANRQAYLAYVEAMQAKGATPLPYAQWAKSQPVK